MKRAISLLVLGIAVGCAGTLLLERWLSEPPTYTANSDRWRKALSPAGAGVGDAQLPELLSGTGSVAEQSAIALIAARTDAAGIRERILEVVASPPSARRRFALDLLIARYAELDPGAAANLVHELDLDDSMLARVFAVWAELDDAGAMAALRQEIDEGRAVAIALAFAAKLGNDEQAADRVAAALPPSVDVDRFRIELIEQVAETAPERAMRMALALEKSATRSQALARVAAGWADADPAGGLRQAAGIENYGERQRFIGQLGRDWAGTDPDAVLRLIEAGGNDPDMRTLVRFAASTLAASRPRQALAIAADLEPQVANTLRSMALNAIAESDPLAAIELLRDIPASEHRKNMLRGIAQVYAHQDPDTALAWAESLPEHERAETLSAIVGSIAGTDPDRAVEISLALEDRARSHALHYIVMQSVYSLGNGEELGRRLLAIQDDDDREQAIGTFVSMWASQDPEATLDWILANDAATNSRTIGQVGRQLAQHDPRAALRMTGRLPAESREAWITQIAGSFAQADPQGAMAWLQQSQGQPHYEAALAAISRHTSEYDPQSVAALVPSIRDAGHAATVATAAAQGWGQREPRAAANWALQLADERVRSAAVASVARQWAGSDSPAAEQWVLSLARGPIRDNALRGVVSAAARDGRPLEPLFDAFSADSSRSEAAQFVVYVIAERDVEEARAFLNEHVNDEATRYRMEQRLLRNFSVR